MRRIVALVSVVVLCVCLAVPVFAAVPEGSPFGVDISTVALQPLPVVNSSSALSDFGLYREYTLSSNYEGRGSAESPIYLVYLDQAINSNTHSTCYFVNSSEYEDYDRCYYYEANGFNGAISSYSFVCNPDNMVGDWYYYQSTFSSSTGYEFFIPSFDTAEDAISAIEASLQPSGPSGPVTIALEPGNVMYFRTSSPIPYTVKTSFPGTVLTSLGNVNQSGFSQRFGTSYYTDIPASGSSDTWTNGVSFEWSLEGGVFGFGSSYISTGTMPFITSGDRDLRYVYNPYWSLYPLDGVSSTFVPNNTLYLTFSDISLVSEITIVPLQSTGLTSDLTGQTSNISDKPEVYVVVNTDGSTYTVDEDGNLRNQVTGGGDSDLNGRIVPVERQYDDFFTEFADGLNSIFTGVISAFNTLINGASGFISSLGQIFAWLPPELVGTITAAITVVVVAGVIKAVLP